MCWRGFVVVNEFTYSFNLVLERVILRLWNPLPYTVRDFGGVSELGPERVTLGGQGFECCKRFDASVIKTVRVKAMNQSTIIRYSSLVAFKPILTCRRSSLTFLRGAVFVGDYCVSYCQPTSTPLAKTILLIGVFITQAILGIPGGALARATTVKGHGLSYSVPTTRMLTYLETCPPAASSRSTFSSLCT